MHDRQPKYPGRIKLRDIETGEEKIYDMTMADEPTVEGDAPVTKNLLKQQTAALFGLGSDAVPNDVFEQLGNLANYHIWRKSTTTKPAGYDLTGEAQVVLYSSNSSSLSTSYTMTLKVSDNVSVSEDGMVTQIDPDYVAITGASSTNGIETKLSGKFVSLYSKGSDVKISLPSAGIYYFPPSVEIVEDPSNTFTVTACDLVTGYAATIEDEYVFSVTRSAYPDEDSSGGLAYTYLGRLGDKARVVTGRYVGTGLYGTDNPNTIALPSAPKMVVITGNDSSHNAFILLYAGGDTSFSGHTGGSSGDTYQCIVDKGKNFTWYGNDRTQMNSNGVIYSYAAVL